MMDICEKYGTQKSYERDSEVVPVSDDDLPFSSVTDVAANVADASESGNRENG